jgi:hypothetical protein
MSGAASRAPKEIDGRLGDGFEGRSDFDVLDKEYCSVIGCD